MEVLGAGFGRTGTASLQIALNQLGLGPCYHWTTLFEEPARVTAWEQVLAAVERGHVPAWQQIYDGFRSAVDWPTAAYWQELSDAYPAAKVILTVRDPQDWYDSMIQTIVPQLRAHRGRPAVGSAQDARPPEVALGDQVIGERTFQGRLHDRDHMIATFEAHRRAVEAYLPPERLLVFDVRQGWAPLCAFLGLPQPQEPFPQVNAVQEFTDMMRGVYARTGGQAGAAGTAGERGKTDAWVRVMPQASGGSAMRPPARGPR
ncbi:sulfotransferase family protein [Streptomyces enissocaesilis]|uniref:Sulfotransferase family protein n=1 Tax=Streptomyces enissocaesilis TaxID=332589 RepID=A0ABP6J778_9ACTN